MTLSLSKGTIKDVGYEKKGNKRCIPNEGMPHAQKAKLEKKKNWTHEGPSTQKKRSWTHEVMRTSLLRIQTTLLKMIYKVLLLAHVLDN